MGIEVQTQFIDSDTGQPVELKSCVCGNTVFFITTANECFCSCCKMTEPEAEAQRTANNSSLNQGY